MEHLGQSKTLLSERIAQQKLAEQVEAERWTRELHDSVRSELIKLVKGELDTTVSDMKAATAPLRSAMRQSRREALLLRLFSGIWWKACLIGACLSLGLGFGSWGLLSWLGSEIQQQISRLQALNGVEVIQSNGRVYLAAPKIGERLNMKDGRQLVEVQ